MNPAPATRKRDFLLQNIYETNSHPRNPGFLPRHRRPPLLRGRGHRAHLLRHVRRGVRRHPPGQPHHRHAGHREHHRRKPAAQLRTLATERHADSGRIQTAHQPQLRLPARRRLGRHHRGQLPPHRPDAVPRIPRQTPANQGRRRRGHRPQRRAYPPRPTARARRHLLQGRRRAVRHEGAAGRH